jgi:hypothetical protein
VVWIRIRIQTGSGFLGPLIRIQIRIPDLDPRGQKKWPGIIETAYEYCISFEVLDVLS